MILKCISRKLRHPTFRSSFLNSFDSNKDYYNILGVDKSASESQIKSAFYKLALKYHPDHNKGFQAKFKQINEAYSILSDKKIRAQYQSSRKSYNGNNHTWQRSHPQSQYQHYQNNNYHEWGYQSQWQKERAQRAQYENPYEAYQRFRKQYEAKHSRMKQRQQYEQYSQNQQQINEIAYRMKILGRILMMFSILIGFAILMTERRRYGYVFQQQAYQRGQPGYQLVNINGSPYLQNRAFLNYQHINAQNRQR